MRAGGRRRRLGLPAWGRGCGGWQSAPRGSRVTAWGDGAVRRRNRGRRSREKAESAGLDVRARRPCGGRPSQKIRRRLLRLGVLRLGASGRPPAAGRAGSGDGSTIRRGRLVGRRAVSSPRKLRRARRSRWSREATPRRGVVGETGSELRGVTGRQGCRCLGEPVGVSVTMSTCERIARRPDRAAQRSPCTGARRPTLPGQAPASPAMPSRAAGRGAVAGVRSSSLRRPAPARGAAG